MAQGFIPIATKQVTGQVLPSAVQRAPAGPGAFGGQEAQALKQIGGQIKELGKTALQVEEKERQIAARAEEARLKRQAIFKDRRDKIIADDSIIKYKDDLRNQKQNFFARKGVNIFGMNEDAKAFTEESKKRIKNESKLTPDQTILFEASTNASTELFLNQVSTHHAAEFDKTENDNAEGRRQDAIKDAGDAVTSNNAGLAIDNAWNDLLFGLQLSINKAGMTAAAAKNFKAPYVSTFHENVLNEMSIINIEGAKEYYTNHKKEILQEDRPKIEALLKEKNLLYNSQKIADSIVAAESDPLKRDDIARKTQYPGTKQEQAEMRNATLKELNNIKADEEEEEAAVIKQSNININDSIINGFQAGMNRRGLENIANNALKGEKETHLRTIDWLFKKIDVETDRGIQGNIYEMIDHGEIKTVSDLIEFKPDLSNADYNRFITELRNKKSPDAKVGFVKYATAKTAYETLKRKKYDVGNKEHTREFMFIQSGLDKKAQSLGRDLTPEEARKETALLMVDGEAIGAGPFGVTDPDMSFIEATQKGVVDIWAPDINDDDIDKGQERREIKEAYAKFGIITDNEELLRLYKKEVIMNIPLSAIEKKRLNNLVNQSFKRKRK
jgi:hypothetical protein